MADEQLKQLQQQCLLNQSSNRAIFHGNMFRLFTTARTLAWLSRLHFGLSTDDLSQWRPPESLSQDLISGLDGDNGMLVFLTSCLVACLCSACDYLQDTLQGENSFTRAEDFSTVISCLCGWLSWILIRSRVALTGSSAPPDSPQSILYVAALELRKTVLQIIASPLTRCLECIASLPVSCDSGDLALRSALSLVRSVAGLTSLSLDAGGVATVTSTESRATDEEDLFGSMDDSLFLDIEIGGSAAEKPVDEETVAVMKIWDALIGIVKLSKVRRFEDPGPAKVRHSPLHFLSFQPQPSDQFAVLPEAPVTFGVNSCPTNQGRALASRQIGAICACLAALATSKNRDSNALYISLDSLFRPSQSFGWNDFDDCDKSHLRRVAQCFYSEICCLSADYEPCLRIVEKRCDHIFDCLLEAMLDSDTLERFPSINLKRIRDVGGTRSEQKEKMRLSFANSQRTPGSVKHATTNEVGARLKKGEENDLPGPAYNSSKLWIFIENFKNALSRIAGQQSNGESNANDYGGFSALVEFDLELANRSVDMIPLASMEQECLRRIMFFQGLLSYSARIGPSKGATSFEQLSSRIISLCTYQLVSISEGVKYHVHIGAKGVSDTRTYKHTRLLELQSCYTDLTVVLFSWILRECPSPRAETLESILQCLRDTLFSRVLQGQKDNVKISLTQLHGVAVTGSRVNCVGAGRSTCDNDTSFLSDGMFDALIRRSREIVLHLANEQNSWGMGNAYCLFNSLLMAAMDSRDPSPGIDSISKDRTLALIASALASESHEKTGLSCLLSDRSVFQEAVDQSMRHLEHSSPDELNSIQQLRRYAIHQLLVPKLVKKDIELAKKKGALLLMSHVIKSETNICSPEKLDIPLIASIVQGLVSCLRSALESLEGDDELVSVAFQCAKYVLKLPVPSSEDDGKMLLSWSRDNACESTQPPFALYVRTFATWLNDLGKMLVGRTDEEKEAFKVFRNKAISSMARGRSIWSPDNDAIVEVDDHILNGSLRLIELEEKVFAEKENALPVVNRYAKPALPKAGPSGAQSGESVWSPSASVCRAAKEVIAEVIAVL